MLIFAFMEELYLEAFTWFHGERSPDRFSKRILFRGFSIDKIGGKVVLEDIRTPYYRPVSSVDLKILIKMGFVRGTTYLLMCSDKRKIEVYKRFSEKEARMSQEVINPRKKKEHINTIERFGKEIDYYTSQVRRWESILTVNK